MRRPETFVAPALALMVLVGVTAVASSAAAAESPSPGVSPSASATPCPLTLKFAGALYLDTDVSVPSTEVGPEVGVTEPNPTRCALPDRLKVYRHNGHNTTDEVVYKLSPDTAEVFRSAGATGFPGAGLVRWLVAALVLGIILFAALPAILGHLRQPPVAVGREDTSWMDDA
jgi:hypothetical protein